MSPRQRAAGGDLSPPRTNERGQVRSPRPLVQPSPSQMPSWPSVSTERNVETQAERNFAEASMLDRKLTRTHRFQSRRRALRRSRQLHSILYAFCTRRSLEPAFFSTQGNRMPAPSTAPPRPYLKTHGAKVARRHAVDWAVLLLLAAVALALNFIEPFHRFVGKDMMDTLLYPHGGNTVPIWAVGVLTVLVPVLIFAAVYFKRGNAYDLHHAVLGLLFSVLITGVITEAIKNGVGRPRPDFYWRCFPDGVPDYSNSTGRVICHGDAGVIKEGHKSFPSGHTSWSFAGLGFLSWYLAGKIRVFDRGGHVAKLCIVVLPLLLAAMVGVSRVDDYWHHWQDVFAGGIIGLVVASFCYLQFFPSPSAEHGHWPHAYHHHIPNPEAEDQAQLTPTATSNLNHPLQHDVGIETRTSSTALDSMEAGNRDW